MQLKNHLIVSATVSTALYVTTKSIEISITSFIAGVLVDLDHLFDYWRQHPSRYDIDHFFETCNEYKLKNLYILFHSYELLIILAIFAFITKSAVAVGLAIGIAQHLMFDQIFNYIHPLAYFFTYRMFKQFSSEKLLDMKEFLKQNG